MTDQTDTAGVTISDEATPGDAAVIKSYDFHPNPVMTKVIFEQDEDTSSTRGGDYVAQELEVETIFVNSHDHKYFVLKTERWAFNDLAELIDLLKKAGCQ